ncbi:TKL protein kinase [Saprolegnia diclina VS20]|uniref:TKL protein kinase n=1 Tax=Saprolegnia diclina (strain VS20) TaxID=1156394 RepID=T0S5Z5_SAPDV|nr:TKL protein kinase [Saprolegnia diclina VS20]EQC38132.1 TKL protein kinase [Saprolegnia diclina VS20]|eukprot:XP_008608459.1 TKL protein kinase [Saprolegnia diclina VS20]
MAQQLRVVLLVALLQLVTSELHQSLLAVCTAWDGVTCPFATAAPLSPLWDRRSQTLCKASVAVSVKQIDWQSNLITGKGLVRSVKVNGNELLTSLVYPSDAYVAPNYPHCDDWYDVLPPHGNYILPGRGGQRSILPFITNATLAFQIEFEWTGDHSQRHDCSFGGISYVGLAQMDVYYEIQDDSACPGWHAATHSWCSGHGQCDCAASKSANRTCLCQPGYAPPDCANCMDNFYGHACTLECLPCENNGTCNAGPAGDGECTCAPGFDPATRCATCLPSFFGPTCDPCPHCHHPHGNCNDGIHGNGLCSCAVGYNASINCADCMDSFYGPDCIPCESCHTSGRCNHGIAGDGSCICSEGFSADSRCTQCSINYFGANCTRCESCHGRGYCNDTLRGDGRCLCDEGYTATSRCVRCKDGWDFNPTTMSCQCAPEHFGPHCRSCPICKPHGRCNAGNDGDGRCICDPGWSASTNCVTCMGGYFGLDCQICRRCGQGRCDDALHGSGHCVCREGWSASSDCYNCAEGYFGSNCASCPEDCGHGTCSSGLLGSGACSCHPGWAWSAVAPCTTCLPGHTLPHCYLCPGYTESGLPCNGHGTCVSGDDDAACVCDARFSGAGCEVYDFPLAMVCAMGMLALSSLGFCMCTMRRLARHPRYPPLHAGGFHRRYSTFTGAYVEISDMSDLEFFVSADSRDWLIPFEALTLQREVGNGTSGQVFQSLYHSGGGNSVVAVKRLYSPVTGQEYFQSFFRREVSILSKLHHPNVVRFYGVSYYNRVLYIVTDFCRTSLSALIENLSSSDPFESSFLLRVMGQITAGMAFLHSRSVVHRDLKPANVLLNDTDDINICDFGLSRLIDPEQTSMTAEVGTPSYMAPEMATMGATLCSTKGDVYSYGILLYSMWSRSKPYGDQGMNPFQLMTAVVSGLRPVIPINCPPGLARLMRQCWDANPLSRPSFPEISLQLKDPTLLQSARVRPSPSSTPN